MSDLALIVEPEVEEPVPAKRDPPRRDRDLLGRQGSKCRDKMAELFDRIARGFEDQIDRAEEQRDAWDCYHCELGPNEFYNGTAQVYVPAIRDAVDARATRFVNQLFPPSGQFVEALTSDGKQPFEILALLSNYIKASKLKNDVARPMCINGDIEGQYNLYVDWSEVRRQIVSRETSSPTVEMAGQQVAAPGEEFDDMSVEDTIFGRPAVEVLHDSDVLVWPPTADTVEEALAAGGGVAIVRRWSKGKIDAMIDAGEILKSEGAALKEAMGKMSRGEVPDIEKRLIEMTGIRKKGKEATVWEVWTMQPLAEDAEGTPEKWDEDGELRLCRGWFGLDDTPLGLKRNPHWNDLCPFISHPVKKMAGVFKGPSLVVPLMSMQYEANAAANEAADAAHFSAMPIVRHDPVNAPGPFVLNIGALWAAQQGAVEFMAFPDLTPRAVTRIGMATQQIFQSLGVNPAMLPQQTGRPGAKRNQAEVALELQVDILTTAEASDVIGNVLTDLMAWFVDLDYQFRDRDLTVRAYGSMGVRAEMLDIKPLQNRARYWFSWVGAQQAQQNVAMMQQGTALLNMARSLGPQLAAEGYRIKLGPALERAFINTFGAATGALILEDARHQLTMDPMLENELMDEGHEVFVHPLDDDAQHIKAHQADMQSGDPTGNKRVHIGMHLQSMQMKNAAAMQQQMAAQAPQQGQQPGGARPGRGGAPPRIGAQPAGPRLVKGPIGGIPPDQMSRAGAPGMPRKM